MLSYIGEVTEAHHPSGLISAFEGWMISGEFGTDVKEPAHEAVRRSKLEVLPRDRNVGVDHVTVSVMRSSVSRMIVRTHCIAASSGLPLLSNRVSPSGFAGIWQSSWDASLTGE